MTIEASPVSDAIGANSKPFARKSEHDPNDLFGTYKRDMSRTPLLSAEQEIELSKRIEAGVYAAELMAAAHDEGHPQWKQWYTLSDEHKQHLPLVADDGEEARQHMIRANTGLVVFHAKRANDRGMPLLDVIQEGNLGLMHAVEKFDYTLGFKFSSYASLWIKKMIAKGVAEQSRTIRVTEEVYDQANRITRVTAELSHAAGVEPPLEQVAEEVDMTMEKVSEILGYTAPMESLNRHVRSDLGDARELGDFIAEQLTEAAVEDAIDHKQLSGEISALFSELDEQEALVIRMRFGFDDGNPKVRSAISEALGVSVYTVTRIEQKAFEKLKSNGWWQRLETYKDLLT